MFNLSITGCAPEKSTGVAFIICHYNRIASLARCLESVWPELRRGDSVILIDNGSPLRTQQQAISLFMKGSLNVPEFVCKIIGTTLSNRSAGSAFNCAIDIINSSLLPNLQHALILADDDLLTLGWREKVTPHLLPNSWINWGYHFISWPTEEIQTSKNHSGRIIKVSGKEAHNDWLHGLSNRNHKSILSLDDETSPQIHSSCGLLPVKALKSASNQFETLVPLPYYDIGLAMIVKYASEYVYIDQPLGLIGRGSNYAMGDNTIMVANHPSRGVIHGLSSHVKYSTATYVECFYMLNRLDLILPSAMIHLKWHLSSKFGTYKPPLRYIFGKVKRLDFSFRRQVFPDFLLSILLMAPRTLARPLEYYILWMLGATEGIHFKSRIEIQNQYLSLIRCQEKIRAPSYQLEEDLSLSSK